MRNFLSVQAVGWIVGAVACAVLATPAAWAGLVVLEPELAVTGGAGVPGGTVAVTVSLANDVADAGVSVDLDLRFDGEALEFTEPVAESCAVAERLSRTHSVGGMLDGDVLVLAVFISGTPNPPPPLGNGEIVTCDFRIKDGVPTGTVALEIEAPYLGDAAGAQIPVRVLNGSVQIISEPPTPTPTATATPKATDTATATATVTNTRAATATNTAAATATATNTRPTATATASSTRTATATVTPTHKKSGGGGGGCNVVPTDASTPLGAAALLVLPALLLGLRRRD